VVHLAWMIGANRRAVHERWLLMLGPRRRVPSRASVSNRVILPAHLPHAAPGPTGGPLGGVFTVGLAGWGPVPQYSSPGLTRVAWSSEEGSRGAWPRWAAVQGGAQVTLVARAPGATALYAGGMEIAADLREMDAPGGQPALPSVRAQCASTTWRWSPCSTRSATRITGARSPRAGLKLAGSWRTTGWFADVHGRRAAGAPWCRSPSSRVSWAGCRASASRSWGVSAVGDYDAVATGGPRSPRPASGAVPVTVGHGPAARRLDHRPGRPPGAVRAPRLADAIAYPPGLVQPPGQRLRAARDRCHRRTAGACSARLDAALADHGVQVAQGRESAPVRAEGRRLAAALTASTELTADQFVLATGRYLGGRPGQGACRQGARVRPRRLPTTAAAWTASGRSGCATWSSSRPHPAFRTGVLTDNPAAPPGLGRPWSRTRTSGRPGSLLGGYDYIRGYGFGVPMVTGWLAGRWSVTE